MRLSIIGDGKMGSAIAELAPERGHEVAVVLGESDNAEGAAITRDGLGNPDVVLEFTEPKAAVANVVACARAGLPVVVGTTGWYAHLPVVIEEVVRRGGRMLWAPNFSLGVAAMQVAAEALARAMRDTPGFDVHLVETHHAQKKDKPSGTAVALAAAVKAQLGRDVPVTSVRVGRVPGTHELVFDGAFEQVRLVHEARDRRVFAEGALRAAEWLAAHDKAGVYTMRDVLQADREDEK